jgi:hypothetical protein
MRRRPQDCRFLTGKPAGVLRIILLGETAMGIDFRAPD